MKDKKYLYNLYKQKGYFKIPNFFPKKFIDELNEEILNVNNVKKYYDKNHKLRRIERLYNKGEKLNSLNDKILRYVESLFKKNFVIFKDKFNAKPKGGDGFLPHYDGIFYFKKKDGSKHKGWHKYSSFFINALVALDECNEKSGTLQVANADFLEFDKLLENTRKDGTPFLRNEYSTKLKFESIDLNPGDLLFFSHLCPHKSNKNKSNNDRKILYYTYAESNNSDIYEEYYKDKDESVTSKGGAL